MSHLFNTTDLNFPYRKDDTLQDSQVSFDEINNIIIVTVPVLHPRGITEASATYTILLTDDIIRGTANSFTVTLPTAVGITGKEFEIKNAGAGVITLEGDGSELIDGQSTQTIGTQDSIKVVSFGTGWDTLI